MRLYLKNIDFKNDKLMDLNEVVISPSAELLKGVEVRSDQPMVTFEIDKKVINVEQMNTVVSSNSSSSIGQYSKYFS